MQARPVLTAGDGLASAHAVLVNTESLLLCEFSERGVLCSLCAGDRSLIPDWASVDPAAAWAPGFLLLVHALMVACRLYPLKLYLLVCYTSLWYCQCHLEEHESLWYPFWVWQPRQQDQSDPIRLPSSVNCQRSFFLQE